MCNRHYYGLLEVPSVTSLVAVRRFAAGCAAAVRCSVRPGIIAEWSRLLDGFWRKLDRLQKLKVEYLRPILTDGAIFSAGYPNTIVIEEVGRGSGSFAPFFLPDAIAQSGE